LRQRYGIEERIAAGCVFFESLRAYTEGYNTVATDAAKRKSGRDIFKETVADAIKKSMNARTAAAVQ
jgi:hypothetical protein